jgi:hypothetical protein
MPWCNKINITTFTVHKIEHSRDNIINNNNNNNNNSNSNSKNNDNNYIVIKLSVIMS